MYSSLYGKILWRNIILLLLAISIIGVGSFFIIFNYGTEKTYMDNARVADIIAKRVDNFLNYAIYRTIAAAHLLSAREHEERAEFLQTIHDLTHVFDGVTLLDENGVIRANYPRNESVHNLNLKESPSVKAVLAGDDFSVSEAFTTRSGRQLISFHAPVKNSQGRIEAIINCTIDLKENDFFKNLVEQLNTDFGGYGYIVDSQGRVLIHLDDEFILHDFSANPAVKEVIMGNAGHLRLTSQQGKEMLAAYNPIGTTNWGVIIQEPLDSVISPMKYFMGLLVLVFLVLLVLSLFINHILVQKLVKPIKELINGMNLASRGVFSQQIAVAGDDEIAYLAKSFNSMVTELETIREGELSNLEELKNAEKLAAIGELAAGTAHEIRNPLTAIKGFIQMLSQYDVPEAKRIDYLKIISEEIKSIEKITGNFLSLAKSNPEEYKKVDLKEVLHEVAIFMGHEAFVNNVKIETEFASVPVVFGSDMQLKQVFVNLIKNAIEAMAKGGLLSLSLLYDEKEERVIIYLKDQGPGIPHEVLSKLGQPFITTKERGTGLGLTVSYRIIQNHLGLIQVNTGARGTVFMISLPAL